MRIFAATSAYVDLRSIILFYMLKEKLTEDLKAAMRAKDPVRLRTIRSLRAALMQKEIEQRSGGEAQLSEADELAVFQKQAKQRRDAIDQFQKAGRDDLVQKEQAELDLIETYLPRQMDDAAIQTLAEAVVAQVGAASMRDMGKVMGTLMPQVKGKADGRRVQAVVKALLS